MSKYIFVLLSLCLLPGITDASTKNVKPVETYIQTAQAYFTASRQERVTVTDEPQLPDAVRVMPKDEMGVVYYRNTSLRFNSDEFKKAIQAMDEGISAYPDFLDMRLAKIAMCSQNEESDCLIRSITEVLSRSKKNKYNWFLSNGDPIPDSRGFLLSAVGTYQGELFKRGNYEAVKEISEAILKFYPKHAPSLVALAEMYMVGKEDYKKAEKLLRKAAKLSPNNPVILADLAEVYSQLGQTEKAFVYQQRAVALGLN